MIILLKLLILFAIDSTLSGFIFFEHNRIIECMLSLVICPPSNGTIGIRLANPSMKFIHANQNRKSNTANMPLVPIVEAISPSPASNNALSSNGIVCPSNCIGVPIISSGLKRKNKALTPG